MRTGASSLWDRCRSLLRRCRLRRNRDRCRCRRCLGRQARGDRRPGGRRPDARRQRARRSGLAAGAGHHRVLAGAARRRASRPRRTTEVRIDLHARHALRRRRLLRPRPGVDHRVRLAPRCRARRHRQLPDDLRHLPRSAERLRVRHQPGGDRVRRPGDQRRAGRRRPRRRQRQQSGSGGGFNLNWDAAWEVRTKIDERGWSAEFAIPFRTLRFPVGRGSGRGA